MRRWATIIGLLLFVVWVAFNATAAWVLLSREWMLAGFGLQKSPRRAPGASLRACFSSR